MQQLFYTHNSITQSVKTIDNYIDLFRVTLNKLIGKNEIDRASHFVRLLDWGEIKNQ